ncbi:MAG: DUF3144 domain-containing protein [Pseudomonadota bacterium]
MTSRDLSDEEKQDFWDLANIFMAIANEQIDRYEVGYVSGAFLYGCARYNAFAMQCGGAKPGEIEHRTKTYLIDCYMNELRRNLGEALIKSDAADPAAHWSTFDLLDDFTDWTGDELWEFREVADLFVNAANDQTSAARVSRISAAFMHACARFNMYELQLGGEKPHLIDEAQLGRYASCYESLIILHMRDQLVQAEDRAPR